MVITCGNCGVSTDARVVNSGVGLVTFLVCTSCQDGSVKIKDGTVYPAAAAGGSVKGLPEDVDRAWREARKTHAVAAYTASEMMCRKILMHLAVDVAGSKEGEKFAQYITDLDNAGYITEGMKSVVDQVRDRGNIANHELPHSTEPDSLKTLAITEYLLRGIYEMAALATP